jgi:hypothetical protein
MSSKAIRSNNVDHVPASSDTASSPGSETKLQTPVKGIPRKSLDAITPKAQSSEVSESPSSSHNKFIHGGYRGIDDLRARMMGARLAQTHLDEVSTKEPVKRVTFDEEHLIQVLEYERAEGISE